MKKLLINWNLMRFVRLVLGIIIIIQGIITKQYIFALIGLLFAAMALLNIGCCGTMVCNNSKTANSESTTKEISYEEVV